MAVPQSVVHVVHVVQCGTKCGTDFFAPFFSLFLLFLLFLFFSFFLPLFLLVLRKTIDSCHLTLVFYRTRTKNLINSSTIPSVLILLYTIEEYGPQTSYLYITLLHLKWKSQLSVRIIAKWYHVMYVENQ